MTTTAATVKLMHVMGMNKEADIPTIVREMTEKSYAGELTIETSRPDF